MEIVTGIFLTLFPNDLQLKVGETWVFQNLAKLSVKIDLGEGPKTEKTLPIPPKMSELNLIRQAMVSKKVS